MTITFCGYDDKYNPQNGPEEIREIFFHCSSLKEDVNNNKYFFKVNFNGVINKH